MKDNPQMPDVFAFDDHRQFLAEAIEDLRRTRRNFSLRWLAQRCEFSSHTYLPKVVAGERSLAPETVPRVAKALGLRGNAERCFRLLVAWNLAPEGSQKHELFSRLEGVRALGRKKRLEGRQSRYYEHWYYPVIRQLVLWTDWSGDWGRLGGYLDPPISAEQAREAVETLVDLGLLEQREGTWHSASPTINVDRLPVAAKQRGRHDILRRGMESLLRHAPHERHTTCLLLAMSEDSFRQATEILTDAAQKCLGLAAADPVVDRVWQVALQVFPASLPTKARP